MFNGGGREKEGRRRGNMRTRRNSMTMRVRRNNMTMRISITKKITRTMIRLTGMIRWTRTKNKAMII